MTPAAPRSRSRTAAHEVTPALTRLQAIVALDALDAALASPDRERIFGSLGVGVAVAARERIAAALVALVDDHRRRRVEKGTA